MSEGVMYNNKKDGFFKYVFNFDNNNKGLLTNLFQYAFIAVPLVILVLKVMNYYTPEEDNSKGSLEILLEIVVSISILLLAVWFINKIIRYIPNISKIEYPEFNEVNFLLPFLIVLLTMQTKLGAKINTTYIKVHSKDAETFKALNTSTSVLLKN